MKVESFQFVDTAQAKDEENKLVKLDIFQSYQACNFLYLRCKGKLEENYVHYVGGKRR